MLILNSSNHHWGAEASLLLLLKDLDKSIYKLLIRNEPGDFESALKNKNISFSKINLTLSPFKISFYYSLFILIKVVLKYKIKNCYCNNDDLSTIVACLKIISFFNLNTFVHYRNFPNKNDYYKKLMFIHNTIICNSEFTQLSLLKNIRYKFNNTLVIPNGHGQKKYQQEKRSKENFFLTVGRIDPNKAQLEIIEILYNSGALERFKYIIVGHKSTKNDYHQKILNYIKYNKIQERVILKSFSPNISNYYKNAIVTIIPSYIETFGRTVIESGFYGTPVIVRSIPALLELVNHEKDGLIWDGSSKNMQKQLDKMYDESFRKKMGRNLREKVLNNFTDEQYLNNIKKIINFK